MSGEGHKKRLRARRRDLDKARRGAYGTCRDMVEGVIGELEKLPWWQRWVFTPVFIHLYAMRDHLRDLEAK